MFLWIFYGYCKSGLQMFLTSSWLTCIWSKRLLWQVSGHFSKIFSTFCKFATFFFNAQDVFCLSDKLTEALKRVTVLHLLLKSMKVGWPLPHLTASFYINTRRLNLKLDESCSLDVNQIYTIKKSLHTLIFFISSILALVINGQLLFHIFVFSRTAGLISTKLGTE